MYCKKCGKYIESGDLCKECMSEQVVFGADVKRDGYVEKERKTRRYGLGRAIVGAALGVGSVILFGVMEMSFFPLIIGWVSTDTTAPLAATLATLFSCLSASISLGVFAAVYGIRSLKTSFHTKKTVGRLPIAPMILGFVAVGCTIASMVALLHIGISAIIWAAM